MSMKKVYLGDAVYAQFDGFHIILSTEDGYRETNTVSLEAEVIESLLKFIETSYKVKINVEKIADDGIPIDKGESNV